MYTTFSPLKLPILVTFAFVLATPDLSRADEVLDWNVIHMRVQSLANVPPPVQGRIAAIVHTAIFDAVNGIERCFKPIHVDARAPRGASARAAAVQAAFTALVELFPAQRPDLELDLATSLAAIAQDDDEEDGEGDGDCGAGGENNSDRAIARGRDWGEHVANAVLAWRSTDGLDPPGPPYLGSLDTGKWRPTAPDFLPGLVPTLAHTIPFAIPSPSSFRPEGPPLLTSPEYAADVNEVKLVGEFGSLARTEDQTESAQFWAGTAPTFWNRAATTASLHRSLTLLDNARLFAILNIAIADTLITAWDAKYFFELWRPSTAIELADTDNNPDTSPQVGWTPLVANPPYPEYYSGHQSVSGAAQAVLTKYFGSRMPVEGFSEGLPGVVRRWPNFAAAADDAFMARIWAGIHFRSAMRDTRTVAEKVAAYVMKHTARPRTGDD